MQQVFNIGTELSCTNCKYHWGLQSHLQ